MKRSVFALAVIAYLALAIIAFVVAVVRMLVGAGDTRVVVAAALLMGAFLAILLASTIRKRRAQPRPAKVHPARSRRKIPPLLAVAPIYTLYLLALYILRRRAAERRRQALWSDAAVKRPIAAALPGWERATQEQPSDPEAWARYAFGLNLVGRSVEALTAAKHALQLNPACASAWARKAAALTNLGHAEEALGACDRALELDPSDASAWRTKAEALRHMGRREEAVSAVRRVTPAEPDPVLPHALSAWTWFTKATTLQLLEQWSEALEAFDRALVLEPRLTVAWSYRSDCLRRLGREAEARAAIGQALKLAR